MHHNKTVFYCTMNVQAYSKHPYGEESKMAIGWPRFNIAICLFSFYFNITELQALRGKVVKQIRTNQQLENDLNLMDIKIGLLVKNRITLQVRLLFFALCQWAWLSMSRDFISCGQNSTHLLLGCNGLHSANSW